MGGGAASFTGPEDMRPTFLTGGGGGGFLPRTEDGAFLAWLNDGVDRSFRGEEGVLGAICGAGVVLS